MKRTHRMGSTGLAAVLMLLAGAAMAAPLKGVRVLPHQGELYRFPGWEAEGALPPALEVPLGLGDDLYGATLQLPPVEDAAPYRVRVQFETSLALGMEGPHLDLTGWKHCQSPWIQAQALDARSFVLPTPTDEQQACFPAYTPAELRSAVEALQQEWNDPSLAERWLAPDAATPYVAISRVRVRIERQRDGRWETLSELSFVPPMGC